MLLRVYSIFPSSFPALSVAFWVQLFARVSMASEQVKKLVTAWNFQKHQKFL